MDILKAKLFPQHAGQLLRDQVLKMDKEWNVLPEDSSEVPYYFFWLMNPDNHAAAKLQFRLQQPHSNKAVVVGDESYQSMLESLKAERDDIYNDENEWFQRELHDLDVQKENLDEYFYYFKKHKTISMLKVHDSVHDRWSQFSRVVDQQLPSSSLDGNNQVASESPMNLFETKPLIMHAPNNRSHFIVALKILNTEYHSQNPTKPAKYNSVGHVAFSVKDQFIDGKVYKVGLAGSGWCAQKYRTQCPSIKFSAWFMKILLMIHMNIRYCYAHVFAENSKSFGYIAKSGMSATRFRLKFLGFNMSVNKNNMEMVSSFDSKSAARQDMITNYSVYQVRSLQEYKTLMDKIYGRSNFLITQLENLYYHPNFAGCFIDEKAQVSFQVWKCKYAIDQKTSSQIPAFFIYNTAHLSQCDIPLTDQQCDQLLNSIRESVIPQLCSHLGQFNEPTTLVNLAFATHGGSIYQYLLKNYSHLESISFASLYYTFQDNFKLASGKKGQSLDAVSKFLIKDQETISKQEEKNLFLDIRDCTGKPMVWSEEIKETEMATIRSNLVGSDQVAVVADPNAHSHPSLNGSIPETISTTTYNHSGLYASKL